MVQNEINNLSFLTGDIKTKMSKVGFKFSLNYFIVAHITPKPSTS